MNRAEGLDIYSRRIGVILAIVVLLCSLSISTSTAYNSVDTFDTSRLEWPNKIITCSDGGFAIAGDTNIRGYDFLLIKTDRYGRMNWIHTYGAENNEFALGLTECEDGGFVLVGYIQHGKGWIVRTDSNGALLWNLTITEENTSSAYLQDVIEMPNGDISAAGYIRSELLNYTTSWLVNIDANGTLKSSMTYGNTSQHQLCKSLILCQNGDLLMVGDTANNGYNLQNIFMIRTNSSGDPIWQRTFNQRGNEDFGSAIETHSGGFAITGAWDDGQNWQYTMFLLKTDSSGNLMWNMTYNGSGVYLDPEDHLSDESTAGRDVIECENNGFAILGATNSYANYFPNNIWFVRTDENGIPSWNYTLVREYSDSPSSMAKRDDGHFAVVASTRENMISSEYDILLVTLNDEAPYTSSTTTSTQEPDVAFQNITIIIGTGTSIVIVVAIFRYRTKRDPNLL